LIKLGISAQA